MYATLDFLKRHRRKIVVGGAILSAAYAMKCVFESDAFYERTRQLFQREQEEAVEAEPTTAEDESLNEARRHFLFDMHQQSCDKILNNLVIQLRKRIDERFSTEKLLDELRNSPEIDAQRKIEIWEELKISSLAKILAVLTIFPLVMLVMKTQRSMVCQQVYMSLCQKPSSVSHSLFETGMHLVKSFFNTLAHDQQHQPQPPQSTSSSMMSTENSNKAQQLFNGSVQYFLTEGVDLLFGCLMQIASSTVGGVKLTEQMGSMDLHFLLERARAKVKEIGDASNFTDFVVPTAQLTLEIGGHAEKHLQNLLKQFVLLLRTQRCRKLMDDFTGQYMESVLQQLDEVLPAGKCLPLAKLIPRLCNAFNQIATSDYTSVFYSTLTSAELHQFTIFVSQCSGSEDLDVSTTLDGGISC